MSRWRYGCGAKMTVFVPRGYSSREVTVECGSTSHTGGVNQCDSCANKTPVIEPYEDETEDSWLARQEDFEERRHHEDED